jgi:hypothetical protein
VKEKDIALVIVIVVLSGVLSFFISNSFISPPERNEKAAVVEPITPEFKEPNDAFFNESSINPTQIIQIEGEANPNPFQ